MSLQKAIDKTIGAALITILQPLAARPSKRQITTIQERPREACFIKLWALGDSVVALPTIRAFKRKFPKTSVTVLARKRNRAVFEGQPFIDHVVVAEPGNMLGILGLLHKFDVVFDLEPYLNISALLSWWIGRERVGFSGQYRSRLYTHTVAFERGRHIVDTYALFVQPWDAQLKPERQEGLVPLRPTTQDARMAGWFFQKQRKSSKGVRGGSIIGIAPIISEAVKSRAWPKEHYAMLVEALAAQGNQVVFFGSKGERQEIEQIIRLIAPPHSRQTVNAAGMFSLLQTAATIARCDCFISNDSGLMHIAAAMGTPTIGLFGPNTPAVWRPYGAGNVALYHKTWCSPCIDNVKGIFPKCFNPNFQECMKNIDVQEVLNVTRGMLAHRKGRESGKQKGTGRGRGKR